jgi:hypothetical protein
MSIRSLCTHFRNESKQNFIILIVDILLLIMLIGCLAITAEPAISSDGAVRFTGLQAIVDGRIPHIKFSLIQPIVSLPLFALANQIGVEPAAYVAYLNLILFVILLAFITFGNWPATPKVRRITALLLISASMFPHHVQHYFGEVLSATFITIGFLSIRRHSLLAFCCIGFGVANTPALMPAYAIALAAIAYKTKRLNYFLFILLPIALFLIENQYKYQSVLPAAYLSANEKGFSTALPYSGMSGFSYPFHLGVLSILFSFGKGLIWFVPSLILFFREDIRRAISTINIEMTACLAFVVGQIVCYAKWWAWYGGDFWGPRFFLFACVPGSILLASSIDGWKILNTKLRLLALVCLFFSIWGSIQGYVFGTKNSAICSNNQYELESFCWYIPEFSPLFRKISSDFDPLMITRMSFSFFSVTILIWLLLRTILMQRPVSSELDPVTNKNLP